jgi:hypothetical protein
MTKPDKAENQGQQQQQEIVHTHSPAHSMMWCQNLVNTLRHKGTWCVPRSGLIFEVDKTQQQLKLKMGDTTDPDFAAVKHEFAKIGWSVVESTEK